MVLEMGYTEAQWNSLYALMASSHRIDVQLRLMDLNHNYLADVSRRLVDGSVGIDRTSSITRSASLSIVDPARDLVFDGTSPQDGALYADRMFEITYGLVAPDLSYRFDIPVGTLPITGATRQGILWSIECQGKESLASANSWRSHTWKKGTPKTSIIISLVRDYMGETKFDIPRKAAKTGKKISIGKDNNAWELACSLASSMGYQLFFDARGICQMRDISSKSTFTFRSGEGGMIKTAPSDGFSLEGMYNCVDVTGHDPKGKKKALHLRLVAARDEPNSPFKLGRTGHPRYIPATFSDSSLKTMKEMRAFAAKQLRLGLLQGVNVAFDTLPYMLGEPGDICTAQTDDFEQKFTLNQFNIPLTASGVTNIGYTKNVKPNATVIRYRKAA